MKAADLIGPTIAIAGALALVAAIGVGRSAHGAEPARVAVDDLPVWRVVICDTPGHPRRADCTLVERVAPMPRQTCLEILAQAEAEAARRRLVPVCAVDAQALAGARGL